MSPMGEKTFVAIYIAGAEKNILKDPICSRSIVVQAGTLY